MDASVNDVIEIEFFKEPKTYIFGQYEDPNRLETEKLVGIVLSISDDCLICAGETESKYYNRFRVDLSDEIVNLLKRNKKKKIKYFIQDIENISNPNVKFTQKSSVIQKDKWYTIEYNSNLDEPKVKDIETEYNAIHSITDEADLDKLLSTEISGNNSKLSGSIDSIRYYSEDLDIMEHLQTKNRKIYSISN